MNFLNTIIKFIDGINRHIGKAVSWLTFLLVLIIVSDVLLRYLFNYTTPATFELEWHIFALIFLLSAGWTLQHDRHVRVDVFYHRFPNRLKAWVNLVGTLLLLLPFCIVAIKGSVPFVAASFEFKETSPDPGGLPARYLIKSAIPIGFFLLALQGVRQAIVSFLIIIQRPIVDRAIQNNLPV